MSPKPYDYCIIGAGLAGSLLAFNLTRAGYRVVIVEAGPRWQLHPHLTSGIVDTGIVPYLLPQDHPASISFEDNSDPPYPYRQSIVKGLGGTTLAWLGTALRLLPDDFIMSSRFGHGLDWPINYKDLEEFYQGAEWELGVAGQNDNPWQSSAGYPLPAFPFDDVDQRFIRACTALNIQTHSVPQARNSIQFRRMPECRNSASCIPFCPTNAKYTALRHLIEAEKTGLLKIYVNAPVLELINDSSHITSVRVYDPDKQLHIAAENFVLSAHTIESIRLLLLSTNSVFPNGVGNSSGLVGCYFMDHPVLIVEGTVNASFALKGYQTLQSFQFYGGEKRDTEGAFKLEFTTSPEFAWQHREGDAVCKLKIQCLFDMLPLISNYVRLSDTQTDSLGRPTPKISIRLGDYEHRALAKAKSIATSILAECGATTIDSPRLIWGMGHPSGGCRMSRSSLEGVVDANLKAHDLNNLFIVGSSVFPTVGAANPSLTIAALALRLSAHLIEGI